MVRIVIVMSSLQIHEHRELCWPWRTDTRMMCRHHEFRLSRVPRIPGAQYERQISQGKLPQNRYRHRHVRCVHCGR